MADDEIVVKFRRTGLDASQAWVAHMQEPVAYGYGPTIAASFEALVQYFVDRAVAAYVRHPETYWDDPLTDEDLRSEAATDAPKEQ